MGDLFDDLVSGDLRLAASIVLILVIVLLRVLAVRFIHRRVEDEELWYRSKKASAYASTGIALIGLGFIWLQNSDVGAWLGLVSAGLAIALAEVIKNIVGWGYIILRRPFKVGDRIEIKGIAGDVVDVRAQRFSMLEIRNWVDADQSTGRILHVPNGMLFTEAVANFSEGFPFIWHEIPMLVTFESDFHRADEIMREVLDLHAPDMASERAMQAIRSVSSDYRIKYTHLTPTTYVAIRDSGVLITGRVIVPIRSRRHVDATVSRALLERINAEPSVELAYPTVRTFLPKLVVESQEA